MIKNVVFVTTLFFAIILQTNAGEKKPFTLKVNFNNYSSNVFFDKDKIEYNDQYHALNFEPHGTCGKKILDNFKSNLIGLISYERKSKKKSKIEGEKIEFFLEQKKFYTSSKSVLGQTMLSFISQIEILKTQEYQQCRSKS